MNSENQLKQKHVDQVFFETSLVHLHTTLKAVAALGLDEATIEASGEGLRLRTMDTKHISLVDIELKPSGFRSYDMPEGGKLKFAVRVDEFEKVLRNFDRKDSLNVTVNLTDSIIKLAQGEHKVSLRLTDPVEGDTPMPKLRFDTSFTIPTDRLAKVVKAVEDVSEYITIKSYMSQKVKVEGKGDAGETSMEVEGLEELSVREESTAYYSIQCLKPYLQAVKNFKEDIEIGYSSKMPLRAITRLHDGEYGTITYYLAPRVED